jgi:hypothetical protein
MAAAMVAGVGVLPSLILATLSDFKSALTPSKALGDKREAAMTATIRWPSGPHPKAGLTQRPVMIRTIRQVRNLAQLEDAVIGWNSG